MKDGQPPDAVEQERLQEFLRWRQASSRRRPASGRRVLFFCIGATAGVLTGLLIMMVVRAVLDGPARLVSAPTQTSAEDLGHTARRFQAPVERTRPGVGARELVPAETGPEPAARLRSTEAPPAAAASDDRPTAVGHRRGVRMERRTRPAREPVADLAQGAEVGARSPLTAPAEPVPRAAATGAVASSPASTSRTTITGAPTLDTPDSVTIADRSRPISAPLDPGSARRDPTDHAETGAASSTNALTSAMPATLAADVPRDVAADSPPSPPVTASLDPVVSGSQASGARGQRSRTMETMTRLIDYIPEVRVGRAIFRWVKSQPPVDHEPRPSRYEAPQAR